MNPDVELLVNIKLASIVENPDRYAEWLNSAMQRSDKFYGNASQLDNAMGMLGKLEQPIESVVTKGTAKAPISLRKILAKAAIPAGIAGGAGAFLAHNFDAIANLLKSIT